MSARISLLSRLRSSTRWNLFIAIFITLLLLHFRFHVPQLLQNARSSPPPLNPSINWSRVAYAQYTTDASYLCNAVMNVEALHRLGVAAQKVILYPSSWTPSQESNDPSERMLQLAQEVYGATLVPFSMEEVTAGGVSDDMTWEKSFAKLLVFNQTQYDRVLHIDSDSMVLQSMDELFQLPAAVVALPRAYWLENTLTSHMMLIEPSPRAFQLFSEAIANHKPNEYDMDIVNNLFGRHSLVFSHRKYGLVTGEFRAEDHTNYLSSMSEEWNATNVLAESKLVHFSDWPLKKPWIQSSEVEVADIMPKCASADGCEDRDVWLGIYDSFRVRRKAICGRTYDFDEAGRMFEDLETDRAEVH